MKEYGDDGKAKKDLSTIEKYYQNLGHKPDPNRKIDQLNDRELMYLGLSKDSSGYITTYNNKGDSFSPVMGTISETAVPETDSSVPLPGDDYNTLEKNSAAFGGTSISPEEVRRRTALITQKRLDDFRHLLDPNLPASKLDHVAGSGMDLEDFTRRVTSPASELYKEAIKDTSESRRSILNPSLGMIDPTTAALHSRVFDDPTTSALGMPNPVKAAPPPKPAETVKQMLDPFGANMMKPKF